MPSWRSNPSLLVGAAISVIIIGIAVFAPWITRWPVDQMDMAHRLAGPSVEHWLGTDNFGRDLWTRIALGARISLATSICSVALAVVIGSTVGVAAGYVGGWTDLLLMRLADIFLGFPALLLALALLAVMGPGWENTVVALTASLGGIRPGCAKHGAHTAASRVCCCNARDRSNACACAVTGNTPQRYGTNHGVCHTGIRDRRGGGIGIELPRVWHPATGADMGMVTGIRDTLPAL